MESQKLLSNKDLLLKNFKEVIENLKDCENYIEKVIVSDNTPYCADADLTYLDWLTT